MNIAAILALLLSSGVCGKSDFQMAGGGTLRVVVCPMVGTEGVPPAGAAPAPEPPRKEERQAMGVTK